jgi:hypothetical protein
MNLQLGFFPDFKGADSVLLEGCPLSIEGLGNALSTFAASEDHCLPIHNLTTVFPHHSVQLFAVRSPPTSATLSLPGFAWQFSNDELPAIQAKLRDLAQRSSGHHYFALAGSTAQLIVSVGEYGESWWNAHG